MLETTITKPMRFVNRMAVFLIAVAIVIGLLFNSLSAAFVNNPGLNGTIVGVLLVGIFYIFRQVLMLNPEVRWIEGFRHGGVGEQVPRLLAPMATMLGDRKGRMSLSVMSMRTLLDGIASRLDEARETSRYLIGTMVFLGLLGTFYGLLETVRSVSGVIGSLNTPGADVGAAFAELKNGLQAPLAGMGTAFSSSLFGLAGSLVLGFLDLQAGQAQNRFFMDLEEWLSGLTRLSGGGSLSESGDQSVPAYIQALLEQTADSLDNLQRSMARAEESRVSANVGAHQLADRLGTLVDHMRTSQSLLLKLAENQLELKPTLVRLADNAVRPQGGAGLDEASRTHLRNLETYAARISEELTQGRTQTIQEVRSEIRLLARTIAALADEP